MKHFKTVGTRRMNDRSILCAGVVNRKLTAHPGHHKKAVTMKSVNRVTLLGHVGMIKNKPLDGDKFVATLKLATLLSPFRDLFSSMPM